MSRCWLCSLRISASSLLLRIVGDELEHEAVELGLGQVVRAFRLDRVLRGQHQERPLDAVALAIDRDAVFLHDLQQGGVRLGRGAVDFVGQQELREDRARAEAELLRLHVEDRRAGHVGGHQVGRELDAAELAGPARGPASGRTASCPGPARFRSARGRWRTGRPAPRAPARPGRRRSWRSRR